MGVTVPLSDACNHVCDTPVTVSPAIGLPDEPTAKVCAVGSVPLWNALKVAAAGVTLIESLDVMSYRTSRNRGEFVTPTADDTISTLMRRVPSGCVVLGRTKTVVGACADESERVIQLTSAGKPVTESMAERMASPLSTPVPPLLITTLACGGSAPMVLAAKVTREGLSTMVGAWLTVRITVTETGAMSARAGTLTVTVALYVPAVSPAGLIESDSCVGAAVPTNEGVSHGAPADTVAASPLSGVCPPLVTPTTVTRVWVSPTLTLDATEVELSTMRGGVATEAVTEPVRPPTVTVIVAVPLPTPVITREEETEMTLGLDVESAGARRTTV